MKVTIINILTAALLLCLLLSAAACGTSGSKAPENTQKPADSVTNSPENSMGSNAETTPDTNDATDTEGSVNLPADPEDTDIGTDVPVYPGDIEIELPELQESSKIILSIKNGQVLGASSLDKPINSGIINSYDVFKSLYGTVEGIDETFFETHSLRLVHTAQSSGSTRYAVESVTMVDGKLKVEIIEQLAAISTRDLRYWYVFAAVEKGQVETPVEVNVTGIQLTA